MMSLFLLVFQLLPALRLAAGLSISMPNCLDQCGNVKIPYPFGIGANCYHDRSYEIICNASFSPSKPFLWRFNLEVLDINWPGRYTQLDPRSSESNLIGQIVTVNMPPPNICGSDDGKETRSYDLKGSPFRFSKQFNFLMMEGCGSSAELKVQNGIILAGCASNCARDGANFTTTSCFGVGCCKASIMPAYPASSYSSWDGDLDIYEIAVDFERPMNSNSCDASVGLVYSGSIENFDWSLSSLAMLPTALQWKSTFVSPPPYDPTENASCLDQNSSCICGFAYEGNPYLPYGCQVVEGCRKCKSRCDIDYSRSLGSPYQYYCGKHLLLRRASFLGFFIGIVVVLLILSCYWLHRYMKKRKLIKQKAVHFKRNGGLLLQQQMSSDEGVVERTKVFTVTELEKATNNFYENRILGRGGQGTVYKGMLMDGKIVAIKKARKVDESQVEQFVNEVVILSQINHRNVVKLLGCCLETEVPVLVYEYIPNGTLYEHIHGQSQDFHLTWKMRLQIAAESAGAVTYLHSSSSTPIYHRDIKSTNILLDEKYRAKVSDFGTSKAISIEQTHATTAVLGTYGYLDPEYFQSHQFTEKSDVYSFGVVLVELITGKKPICPTENGGWISLATEFLTKMEESHLFDILDARVIDEGKEEEFMDIAELARKCLNMNGKQRPTMKEIAVQLDGIGSLHRPVLNELRPAESGHVVAEMTYSDNGPSSKSVFSSDDDPLTCSVEIKPLMAQGTF